MGHDQSIHTEHQIRQVEIIWNRWEYLWQNTQFEICIKKWRRILMLHSPQKDRKKTVFHIWYKQRIRPKQIQNLAFSKWANRNNENWYFSRFQTNSFCEPIWEFRNYWQRQLLRPEKPELAKGQVCEVHLLFTRAWWLLLCRSSRVWLKARCRSYIPSWLWSWFW